MADQFAANGYLCLVVDTFNGDPLPLGDKPPGFDFMSWLNNGMDGKNPHTPEAVDPIVEAAIKALKEEYGVTKLGAVGYCFGAKVRLSPSTHTQTLPFPIPSSKALTPSPSMSPATTKTA